MGKVLRFKSRKDNVIEFLQMVMEEIEKQNIDNVLIACKKKSTGDVLTGYANLHQGEKQELLGHIQVDIVRDMINRNYLR